jgi:hypothetical protein
MTNIQKNFADPVTVGERAADTPAQAAARAAIDEQRVLEREYEALYSIFFAHGTSRARQMEVSARLDEIESRLSVVRANLAGTTKRVAKSDSLTDAERGANALDTIMHTPTLRKQDLPDVFELDNSIGVRTQTKVK